MNRKRKASSEPILGIFRNSEYRKIKHELCFPFRAVNPSFTLNCHEGVLRYTLQNLGLVMPNAESRQSEGLHFWRSSAYLNITT
jgi:hypothetical protein